MTSTLDIRIHGLHLNHEALACKTSPHMQLMFNDEAHLSSAQASFVPRGISHDWLFRAGTGHCSGFLSRCPAGHAVLFGIASGNLQRADAVDRK